VQNDFCNESGAKLPRRHYGRGQLMTHRVTSPSQIDALRKVHSITSSALSWIAVDSSTPIASAVLRLMRSR
jgi:hypothetical protein